jgi:predicted metal-dependent hydrolase
MISKIQLNNLTIEVTCKKMKNIRLRIYPNGQVKVSAPLKMKHEIIHSFLVSKLTLTVRSFFNKFRTFEKNTNNRRLFGKKMQSEIAQAK